MAAREQRYWLMKSEPEVFSFEDLWRAPKRTTPWDGVRNHQARNFMRDQMGVGDGVLYYHSNADPPCVAGLAEVASAPYPDPTQFDSASEFFDPRSSPEAPTWLQVDVRARAKLPRPVPLAELKAHPKLAGMLVCQRGNRLSVQPVEPAHWREVLRLAGYKS